MREHLVKRYNKNLLPYHYGCPAKYRKKIFTEEVENYFKQICRQISLGYEIYFVEIGAEEDHLHFLTQSVPMMSPTKIITTFKSITARALFEKFPKHQDAIVGRTAVDERILCEHRRTL